MEVNGDFFHANPIKYKADDIIPLPRIKKTAQELWDKDERKKKIAEKFGYQVVYIWENEINKCYDEKDLEILVYERVFRKEESNDLKNQIN